MSDPMTSAARLDVCKHKQCIPFDACLYGVNAEGPAAPRNVRVVWVDADCSPVFEWTTEPSDSGRGIYPTFTQAKHNALLALRGAKDRVAAAIRETERMRREDVDA